MQQYIQLAIFAAYPYQKLSNANLSRLFIWNVGTNIFFLRKMRNKYMWWCIHVNGISFSVTNVYSNRPFCDLVPFLPYRSRMKSFIILLVVAIFLTASDGYPVKLQINPCLCSCYGLFRSCQNRCNDMTDSGQRSRCNSSCAENNASCNRSCLFLLG